MLSTKLQTPIFLTPNTRVMYGNVNRGNKYPDTVNILLYNMFFLMDVIISNPYDNLYYLYSTDKVFPGQNCHINNTLTES